MPSDDWMESVGRPQREVCPDCGGTWIDGDRYCRFCGALMSNPAFTPERFSTIYGPRPMNRTHRCTACGHEWITCLMIDRERFCPLCGEPAPVTEERDE